MKCKDQLGRVLEFKSAPQRLVSLVPSITELLFDLGLEKQVVGITNYCLYPTDKVKSVAKVGGTKNPNLKRIALLQPDLVIAAKEENTASAIESISKTIAPVWVADVVDFQSAIEMMRELGKVVNKVVDSEALIKEISSDLERLEKSKTTMKVAYVIWKKPWMVAGNGTFIHAMLQKAGFKNVFEDKQRYPETTIDEMLQKEPDFIFLSSEPYDFDAEEVESLKKLIPKHIAVVLVDGAAFSWYGSRMKTFSAYCFHLRAMLNPLRSHVA